MPEGSQREAVALIYALARKGLSEPGLEREALRRIAGAVERSFMGNEKKSAGTDALLKGR